MNARQLLRTLACTCAIVILPGCDRLTLLLVHRLGQTSGHPERPARDKRTPQTLIAAREGRLYILDTATGEARLLLDIPGEVLDAPHLSPDGFSLYFVRG